MEAPLKGILVVDFSQFLAGPFASLRLQDLGARVIKVENPSGGDLCRSLYLSQTAIDGGDSTLFHAINRGKESIALDLKQPEGLAAARKLASQADIVLQNFRPGVIERLGLDYESVRATNPTVVYGSVSGYGADGPWSDLPGQDLLAQARSGLMWLSGNNDSGPVPVGIPLADILAGATLAHGLLAGLYAKATRNIGTHIETSLLECLVDAQFEFLTTYLNSGEQHPERAAHGSAHVYLGAPYGLYETAQGQLALAMTPMERLADKLDLPELRRFSDANGSGFSNREEIRNLISQKLITRDARSWEAELSEAGIWCARVLRWSELINSKTFQMLDIISSVSATLDMPVKLLRPPLRLDGNRSDVTGLGPRLNEHWSRVKSDFDLT